MRRKNEKQNDEPGFHDRVLTEHSASIGSSWLWNSIETLTPAFRSLRHSAFWQDPIALLDLQEYLAEWHIACLTHLRQIRSGLAASIFALSQAEFKADEETAGRVVLARTIRSVMDGVAWRALDYNRPYLRAVSSPQKLPFSADLLTDMPRLKEIARSIAHERGSLVLYNDLTNFLRVGDLTEITQDGDVIEYEVKGAGRRIKTVQNIIKRSQSAGRSKQAENLIRAHVARNYGQLISPSGSIPIRRIGMRSSHNLDAVTRLLRTARSEVFVFARVSPYLTVSVQHYNIRQPPGEHVVVEAHKRIESLASQLEGLDYLRVDSIDVWRDYDGHFFREVAPYSVFPFGIEECLDIMTGRTRIASFLHYDELVNYLSGRGWNVSFEMTTDHSESKIASMKPRVGEPAWPTKSNQFVSVRLRRGGWRVDFGIPNLMRTLYEFANPLMLLAQAEHGIWSRNSTETEYSTTHALGEPDVWV